MSLPDFINRTRRPVDVPPPTRAPRAEQMLGVPLKRQEQTEWCWAAVTAGIAEHHNNARSWQQCELANEVLDPAPEVNCCEVGSSDTCNRSGELPPAMKLTGNYVETTGSISFGDVMRQIDQGRPIICHIEWEGGSKHFVVIDGYSTDDNDEFVWIKDPSRLDPIEAEPYSHWELRKDGYQGQGKWMHSVYTKPADG